MRLRIQTLLAFALLAVAHGDQWISPRTIDLTSENGEWTAQIRPETRRQTFNLTESQGFATATILNGDEKWQFQLRNQWMPVDTILLNNGQLITFDDWHRMGYGESVAVLYSKEGKTLWHHTLSELITKEKEQQSAHTVSSKVWRKSPVEWQYGEDESSIIITLVDEHQLEIELDDGATQFIEVQDMHNDPERISARARAENRLSNYRKESELFEKVIELTPGDLNAYIALGASYNRQQLYAKAVTLLKSATERFSGDSQPPYSLANLYCELATAYAPYADIPKTGISIINGKMIGEKERQFPNNLEAAEAALRIACSKEPSYNRPYQKLTKLLEIQGRESEVDALMQLRSESVVNNSFERQRIISDIGNYYKSRKKYAVAADWYEKDYSPTKVSNTFSYTTLAEVYERLGKYDPAIAIHRQLIAHWEGMNSGDIWNRNIKKSEEIIAQLIHKKNEPTGSLKK